MGSGRGVTRRTKTVPVSTTSGIGTVKLGVDENVWKKFVRDNGLQKKHLDLYYGINPSMDVNKAAALLEELLKDLDALGALGLPGKPTLADITIRPFTQKTSVRGFQYDQINIGLSHGTETVFTMEPEGRLGGAEMDSPQIWQG